MSNKIAIAVVVVAVIAVALWVGLRDKSPSVEKAERVVLLKFVNHIQANLPEQDVFVESAGNQIVRVEGATATSAGSAALPLFAANQTIEHDPFKLGESPLGPFTRGRALGLTLGEWLAATGGGAYSVRGDKAELNLEFEKLVPNGVYTVWCSRLTFPPNVAIVDRPCGREDGSQNLFRADADGKGLFTLSDMSPLEESTAKTATVIALAYHSDGKTYGNVPGDFGITSHVHIFALLLPPEGTQ